MKMPWPNTDLACLRGRLTRTAAYLFDAGSRRGGGVYLWKNIEAAKRGHGPAFQEQIRSTYGAEPEFQYFETPIVINNAAKQVIDDAA